MAWRWPAGWQWGGGFLGRLSRDVRGNTLMIVAAALIPLAGMIGGGIDMSRMYITKTRLQHACDAGALAGRRAMGGGNWSQSNNTPNATANRFFDANYQAGAYGSTNLSRSFSENAGKVTGTVSAVLPMTLMRVLGQTTQTIAVTCDAEMRLPNTDVMFVLDVTGSMAARAVATDTDTKIESLRDSVKCFYEIVARLDTDAVCATGTPSGGTGNQVQIRFGFVPYSTNVNVGHLLPPSYFANNWYYQSREPLFTVTNSTTYNQTGQTSSTQPVSYTNIAQYNCNEASAATLNTSNDSYSNNNNTKTNVTETYHATSWSSANNGTCNGTKTTTTTTYQRSPGVPTFSGWHYGRIQVDLTGLKNGSQWANNYQFTRANGANGTNQTISWDGCIEERQTVRATTYDPRPAGANDLNIDMVPNQNDQTTLWAPALAQLIYWRQVTNNLNQMSTADVPSTTADFYSGANQYYCPAEARLLQSWPDATAFDSYVDSLQPIGNTYHDIGMLWGARLMSPTGIFSAQNAYTPQGGEIQRNMIFMTDGDAVSTPCDYTAYGVGWFDQRTTTDVGSNTNCRGERGSMDTQVVNRFMAICTAVKNMNITLWVISFGDGSDTTTENNLRTCASDGKFFTARNSAALQNTFKTIADQISQLRLTG